MSDIIVSCGHRISGMERSYNIFHKAIDNVGKAVAYSVVCKMCRDSYQQDGELFDNDHDALIWLDNEEW